MSNQELKFNPPPPFYTLYTTEAKKDPNHIDHKLFTPPTPVQKPFKFFNSTYNPRGSTIETTHQLTRSYHLIGERHIPPNAKISDQFTPDIEYGPQLAILNKRIASIYVDILDFFSKPTADINDGFAVRLQYLHSDIYNMSHLTNLMREYQARESIITLMKKQIADMKAKTTRLNLLSDASEALIKSTGLVVKPFGMTLEEHNQEQDQDQTLDQKQGTEAQTGKISDGNDVSTMQDKSPIMKTSEPATTATTTTTTSEDTTTLNSLEASDDEWE